MASESSEAMNTLFSAYAADDDDDLDESRGNEDENVDPKKNSSEHRESDEGGRQRVDSESLSDMEESSVHSALLEVNDAPPSFSLGTPVEGEEKGATPGPERMDDMAISDEDRKSETRDSTGDDDDKKGEQVKEEIKKAPVPLKRNVTATRLVSYGPDADEDDSEDEDSEEGDGERQSDEEIGLNGFALTDEAGALTSAEINNSLSVLRQSLSKDEVELPPEPVGKCSMKLQDKVNTLYNKYVRNGQDMNKLIQRWKKFRNPSIYDKLVEYIGIDEKGTNYPPELYNPSIWGPESKYEYLAKQQKTEMDRREKDRKEKQMKEKGFLVERIVGTKKPSGGHHSSPDKKRSKWEPPHHGGGAGGGTQIPAMGPITKTKPAP